MGNAEFFLSDIELCWETLFSSMNDTSFIFLIGDSSNLLWYGSGEGDLYFDSRTGTSDDILGWDFLALSAPFILTYYYIFD